MIEEYWKYGLYIKNWFSIKNKYFFFGGWGVYTKMSEIADLTYYNKIQRFDTNKAREITKKNNKREIQKLI